MTVREEYEHHRPASIHRGSDFSSGAGRWRVALLRVNDARRPTLMPFGQACFATMRRKRQPSLAVRSGVK